jgi:AhpD family alkylhydroperoxidase
MARLPYPSEAALASEAPLVQRIVRERGGLMNLYRMLMHAPPVAEGWLAFLTAVRQKSTLPGRLREMAIMWIGLANGADYEVRAHAPIALREGLTRRQVDALAAWRESDAFDARERAVLDYAEAMTRDVHVADSVFAEVRAHLPDRELVELTVTIAAYNMVSRFLEATGVDPDARPPEPPPAP